ncbi:hypothetical protein B296_00056090 [Ensete ventricosum]|uniref:Uncharacterized protein n=1 Tax=Ensete ventricosum TaxID=4639 RepID=A0A426X2V4_ENSVE|nr:hypothetical protein B296_00056090 [Ensete ventricosum]
MGSIGPKPLTRKLFLESRVYGPPAHAPPVVLVLGLRPRPNRRAGEEDKQTREAVSTSTVDEWPPWLRSTAPKQSRAEAAVMQEIPPRVMLSFDATLQSFHGVLTICLFLDGFCVPLAFTKVE